MKTEKNIWVAFILNLSFSVFEFIGGLLTGSVAILSDALHDIADAASIGISWVLEKKSHKQPDETYTYGYGRFSVLGGIITTCILLAGKIPVDKCHVIFLQGIQDFRIMVKYHRAVLSSVNHRLLEI